VRIVETRRQVKAYGVISNERVIDNKKKKSGGGSERGRAEKTVHSGKELSADGWKKKRGKKGTVEGRVLHERRTHTFSRAWASESWSGR